jgi:ferredoxin/coenzyme F420-reducing hydrogenase delta subunit
MHILRQALRFVFLKLEGGLDRLFPPAWHPLYHLGGLAFFCLWIVTVSGIYVYIFFDTGTVQAYRSVEYMTHDQWYLAGVMRSLHRYASDGMVLLMLVHMLREFSLDRYRGARWFTWVTGIVVIWLVYASGITGYWLVWDELAQFVAIKTSEWLDALGIFGEPIARNFLSPTSLDDRFFTLMLFLHIAIPLILFLVLWIHLQRVSRPELYPARGLALSVLAMFLVLSLVKPATSHAPADLSLVVTEVQLDWYYLGFYPLIDSLGGLPMWGVVGAVTIILAAIPWLPPLRRAAAASVNLDYCNGCNRCVEDCPYGAVWLVPRSDGKPFEHEALVSPSLCVSCGICTGSCPTATPFRRHGQAIAGIELPHLNLERMRALTDDAARELVGPARVLIFGCDHGLDVRAHRGKEVGTVSLPCIGMLPPPFIDYVLSRGLAEGVVIAGCQEDACYNRFGVAWTQARIERRRDPYLRERVSQERLASVWPGPGDEALLVECIATLRKRLEALPAKPPPRRSAPVPAAMGSEGDE